MATWKLIGYESPKNWYLGFHTQIRIYYRDYSEKLKNHVSLSLVYVQIGGYFIYQDKLPHRHL